MSNKTRHQPILEYLEALQLEYINAELRKKIYPIPKDRKFYKRTMDHKKKKIVDIATRNSMPTIFDDPAKKNEYYTRVYGEFGIPNFIYKNKDEIEEFRKWDLINYFSKNSDVRVRLEDGEVVVAKITDNKDVNDAFFKRDGSIDEDINSVTVKERNSPSKPYPVLLRDIRRIL